MPRRNNNMEVPTQEDLGIPQTIYLRSEPPSLFVGEHLKKNYWKMSCDLDKKYECAICLEEIKCKDGCERCFSVLTCGHIFHLGCIIRCPQMSCPLCRANPNPQ